MTKSALLIVDVINDFAEGGALPVKGGNIVANRISTHLDQMNGDLPAYDLVVEIRDNHKSYPDTNLGHFAPEGEEPDYATTWPEHAVKGTHGSERHSRLVIPEGVPQVIVYKGHGVPSYSGFDDSAKTENGEALKDVLVRYGIGRVDVVGLAYDHCVIATALDSVGLVKTSVLMDLTAAIDLAAYRNNVTQSMIDRGVYVTWSPLSHEYVHEDPTYNASESEPEVQTSTYNASDYPPFAVTADIALFTIRNYQLCVLLIERKDDPFAGSYALPGGFTEIKESADDAAFRELAEETGIAFTGHLEQLATYSEPDRDPRMRVVSVAYVALAANLPDPQAGSDATHAAWIPVNDILDGEDGMQLAFDHEVILTAALDRVRAKLEYTSIATEFVAEPFSLSDIYEVYRAVWNADPQRQNLQRKILSTDGFVKPFEGDTDRSGKMGRPARLYVRGSDSIVPLHPALLRGEER